MIEYISGGKRLVQIEIIPIKGLVKRLTTNLTNQIVTARGSNVTRPTKKYLFISSYLPINR